ncbi:MAG: AI-2E family transporter, partial [Elusimicrobia bacterium]|nr:AI-2E family transporter [Candidatus Obscuribacterium magneticum]
CVKEFAIPFRADRFIEGLLLGLPAHVLDVAHVALWIVIVPFVAFFGLSQGKNWIDFLFDWTPSNHVEGLLGLLAEINAKLGGYFRGVMVESMGVGLLTMAGLGLMDIQGAVLLGCLSGVLNVIPFLAPVVGGGIALLAAYFQGKALSVLLGIILLYAVVRLFDDVILVPFIIGPSVQLHPVVVVFAVLAGVEVGGFLGLIFAVPAAVVIKVFLSLILRQRRESILLGQPHIYS